jgi:FHA domain
LSNPSLDVAALRQSLSQLATKGAQPYWISEVGSPLLNLSAVRDRAAATGEDPETALVASLRDAAQQLTPSYRDLVSIVLALDPTYLGWSASERRIEAGRRFRGVASESVKEGTIRTYHEPRAFDALIKELIAADHERAASGFESRMPQAGAYLRFVLSNDQRSIALPEGESATIGRSAAARVQIDEGWVSRIHAELVPASGRWQLRDMGSTNGTSVNGNRVGSDPVLLSDGDLIEIGRTILAFHKASEPELESAYATARARPQFPTPTRAQMHVLRELVRPMQEGQGTPASNEQIAARLSLSVNSVKSHLRILYQLFDIRPHTDHTGRRLELARRALDMIDLG